MIHESKIENERWRILKVLKMKMTKKLECITDKPTTAIVSIHVV